jgi:hypothetical protein
MKENPMTKKMIRSAEAMMLAVLSALCIVAVPLAAAADDLSPADQCRVMILTLRAQTETVPILGNRAEMDRAGLLFKLDNADAKVVEEKLADAIQKLGDYQAKVLQLGAAGKMNADDAAVLANGAAAIIACLASLGA